MKWFIISLSLWAPFVFTKFIYIDGEAEKQISSLGQLLACNGDCNEYGALPGTSQPSLPHGDIELPPEDKYPVVDLGYARHQAAHWINSRSPSHIFRNIRYAAPPLGNLRFKAPQDPLKSEPGVVENGWGRQMCLNAEIKWADNFPEPPSESRALDGLPPLPNPQDRMDPIYGEDCLTLDVFTPKEVYANRHVEKRPVIVWIYGGAYIFGGTQGYPPAQIINRSLLDRRGGVVWVMMNYRMGALGFAAGKDIPPEDINAGLLDQRKALEWVQEHIDKFGGDPDQVTITGLSAGGGSVMHHLTAYGQHSTSLFHRAVSYSGGWSPVTNRTTGEAVFQDFMRLNNVSSLEQLRQISEEQMKRKNADHIMSAPPGNFYYNPIAWGDFAPKSPSKLLLDGDFAKNVDVLISHSYTEGNTFTPAFDNHNTTLDEFFDFALPDATIEERAWINKTYGEGQDTVAAIAGIIGDVTFRCHAPYIANAIHKYSDTHNQNVWRQTWNVGQGHGLDMPYLFWPLDTAFPPLVNSTRLVDIVQDYMVTFAIDGIPSTTVKNPLGWANPKDWVPYRQGSGDGKVTQQIELFPQPFQYPKIDYSSPVAEHLCDWWQKLSFT